VYRLTKEYDKALADLNEAIWLDSEYGNAYHLRSLVYRARGDGKAADADRKTGEQLGAALQKARPPSGAGLAWKQLFRVAGQLTSSSPKDSKVPTYREVHVVRLAAGKTYVLALHAEGRMFTPFLRLEDPRGKEVRRKGVGSRHTAQFTY